MVHVHGYEHIRCSGAKAVDYSVMLESCPSGKVLEPRYSLCRIAHAEEGHR